MIFAERLHLQRAFSGGSGLLALFIIGFVIYLRTLDIPFYLDDFDGLANNAQLRDLAGRGAHLFGQRGVTEFTFALNIATTGLSLKALHLTNLLLHLACAALLWRVLLRLQVAPPLAWCGALLFVVHPLQSQAVNYLIQRATLLSTAFTLLALLGYLTARSVITAPCCRRDFLLPYGAALLCGALAVLSKENAAPLPLLLLACDRLIRPGEPLPWRRSLILAAPFAVVPLLLGLQIFLAPTASAAVVPHAGLIGLQHNDPLHYLFTQFQVLWIYLRLLLLPYGQALEHNVSVVEHWWEPLSLLGLAGLLAVVWWGWQNRRRRAPVVFGLIWAGLGLVVESSVIPLDPMFEHRLYLPMGGFVLVVVALLTTRFGERRTAMLLGCAVFACLPLTWQRNELWRNPVAFYEDNLAKHPDSERVHLNLARRYREHNRPAEAEAQLLAALRINSGYAPAYRNLVSLRQAQGRGAETIPLLDAALRQAGDDPELYEIAASLRRTLGEPAAALDYLQRGIAACRNNGALYLNLGVALADQGRVVEAERAYRQGLRMLPDNGAGWDGLGEVLVQQRRLDEAVAAFREAVKQSPGIAQPLFNLGMASLYSGDLPAVRDVVARLVPLDARRAAELRQALAGKESR